MLYEVALQPSPPTSLQVQVVNTAGEPVRDAVVELSAGDPLSSVTLLRQTRRVRSCSPTLHLEHFASSPLPTDTPVTTEIAEEKRTAIVLKLSRRE